MRVLVTGGGGFIGGHLVERLCAEGHDVRVVDNFSTGLRENLEPVEGDIDLVEGDIQSYERAHNAIRGCEVVFHHAALPSVLRSTQDPLTSNSTNVVGTLNVLLAARDEGVRRVVYASSSSVYGANEQLPKQEDLQALPISPYAVAKLAGEGYCRSFHRVYGLETVALRYFNVFGPRQNPDSDYAAAIPRFVRAFLDDESPTVYGDGEQSRDFTYVGNVIDANLRAASAEGAPGRTYNIASGDRITLNRLLDELRALTGRDLPARYEDARPGDVRHSQADLTRAATELGYEPAVSLSEGLQLTVDHYQRRREERLSALHAS
jgi:UDP-glucose 4-epimerase